MSSPNSDEMLRDIERMARASCDFFAAAYPSIDDAEMRLTFSCVSEEKNRLLLDLQPWLPTQDAPARGSAADAVENMYRAAHAALQTRATANLAGALGFGEDQLLAWVERAQEQTRVPALRRVLDAHRAPLTTCRRAMWRLSERLAA